uniref:Microtubule actin crosslinking factor 1 n=1 Tax=Hucho hucho TaxID=62062 RepID=A0A4W5QBU4_9TELE
MKEGGRVGEGDITEGEIEKRGLASLSSRHPLTVKYVMFETFYQYIWMSPSKVIPILIAIFNNPHLTSVFQISEIYVSGESGDLTAKEKLLLWSQQATEGWPGLRCTNFSSSWSNGHMFNALLHRFRPDLIDMEVVAQQSNLDNLEQAFEIAESLGVTRLLDAEDVDVPSPDEKSVITYVSSIYDAFPKIPEGGEGIAAHEVDHRWAEYRSRFSTLLQWSRQHKALMANKNFPLNPVELKALYNEYVHFKETEIPAKELEKSSIERLYKLLEVWMEFGRIKLPLGLHPNDLEEEWGKLILEMLEREKALRPAVERLELLLQMANKIQNMALDCEEKLTLAKNTLQADMSLVESGEAVRCERELGLYLQDCEALIRQLNLDLNVLRDEKYYQVEQLAFRVSCLHEELVSLRLQCSSVYRKGHFSPVTGGDRTAPRGSDSGLSLSTGAQTLLGAVGVVGAMGAALLRRPMSRSQLVAMSSSEDEGSLRFIYELLGWVEETQDVLERAEWGADLPSVEQNLQDHHNIHTAVEELLHSLKEARNYETKVSPNFRSSYSDTLAKLEHQYCKLLEHSSWRLRCLESLHAFVCCCTEELIWLNEREEEELAYDWSQNNTNINAKRELYAEMRSELEEKQEVMHSLQETADRLCQENHPAKQTVEAYSAALQTQWQWVRQLCVCVEQHLKDNTAYFQFVSDARDCETYLRQLQDTIKRQYTCDKSSRLGKLEDLLQDSMEEKEQLIEYRSSVASLVGRAKTVVQLRPRSTESTLGSTTPIRAICDYRQIEITISRGEECVLGDNSQRTKWKVISPSGNEAMVPSVCFTVPPPNQEAMDTASRMEQLYQSVMSLWHNLHVNMKSVVSWHYLQKDISTVSSWSLDTVRSQPPVARDQALDHLEAHLADFLSDSKESALFTPTERRELEREAHNAQEHCQDLLVNMETVEKDESVSRSYLSELQNIKLRLEEAEQRLMRGIQTLPPSNLSGDSVDNTVQIAEQEKLQSDLDGLRISLGEVSRRCVSFFEEKPTSSSVPVLRSELNLAVEKIDRLHNLSSVYLHKLKTVDMLMYSLQAAESQVKRYESRLSEEDIVPADTNAIQALREQLGTWQSELEDQEGVFSSLQSAVQEAREAGTQLNKLHPDRSPELERYQERAAQLTERWAGVKRQMDTRRGELEALGSVLQQYRDGHSALIHWIEETTERQENTQPGKTDSKVLSEQLAQQTALVADIEKNQTKLDECQTHSKQYCTSVKDYELQLMTFRAFVESTQKSTGKRRRMHSSSDAITQEFMDLRTRYTALVTLTTQHVKYISDALRRLEEEEVLYVSLFFIFFFILSSGFFNLPLSVRFIVYTANQFLSLEIDYTTCNPSISDPLHPSLSLPQEVQKDLLTRGEGVAETIRSVEEFLAEHGDSLSPEERANLQGALSRMKEQYSALTNTAQSSLAQLDTAISTTVQQNTQRVRVGLFAELQQLQAQQAQLMQVSQNARSLLDQPDSAVPAKEKRRLRDQLDQLQTQHQEKLRACQERLRRSEALKDELAKFLQEHGGLGTWLEQSEGELCSLGEGETDLAEDVICHKADLRFVSISGQKVLDSVQGALEKVGGSDPALQKTKQLVTGKLQDANHRYSALHTKVTTLTLSPPPLPLSVSDGLEKRFSSLSESVSERAEQLQTSVAQSVSVQEGLKGLLAWLDGLLLTPGPVQPTAQAVQDLLSRQGSVEATCDSVSKLLQSSDASTASGLQRSLESLTQSYAAAQAKQAEREAELRGLLPKLENYERLSTDLQGFTQTCLRALSPAGQPDRSVEDYRQTIEVRGGMLDISALTSTQILLDNVREVSDEKYIRLLITFKHFFTKDLLSDWEAQGVRVQELNKTGSELETLIINITAPQTKTGVPQINGAGSPSSVNGIHTCKGELTLTPLSKPIVSGLLSYEVLSSWRQEASLELRQKARQGTEELSRWLGDRENSLHLGQTAASPSKPEVVRAQAQENKALLSELAEHSGKVKELKSTLEKLIADNPDSPEADTWRQQIKEIDSRWAKANEAAVQRQVELETCADRLGSFATAASQLGPWLKEKELMMSVLGPLSIDPNMLNTQNQQVQFMLREFETRRPQFDQLTQAAEGILSPSGGDSSPQDAKDLAEVRSELGSISQQWDDLTQRLSQRSEHIDQAQGTSQRYQALLKNLSVNVGALGERLDGQASLSAQPEALKRRLQETGEIRSELEQRREELGEAEKLCGELSAIVVEPYLRDELKKRLESVSGPLRSLEERAADGLSQLQAALSSTQQFQQMFKELRSWLDNQSGQRDSTADSLPCQPEAIRTLLAQQDELHRGVASQRGPYELIQAEGASLLASLPTGGEEQSALLSRLTALRRDWDELNQCITERQNRLKSALTKAESYQQHRDELTPWVAECEEREADIQPSLDPAALDEALQKARQLGLDLERRRPLLEALNTVADQLLEHCRVGEEDVRDEKAQLNRRVDGLAENLQNRVSQLEELVSRLKEFEDGRQAVERRLEAARHQIEVQEALGPQACSNKSLERLRSQQETLHSLQPQVAYLRDLAQGLVQDTPHTEGGGGEGGQRLEQQARDTDREFGDVSEKVRRCCCSTLESRLQGVGEVQSSVRDLFSHLADLDDELDSLSPVGRDADSLASQADAVHAFLARLATLRSELEGHGGDCTAMLRREGSSPDLLALRRETEALSRQAGKLSERGQARLGQIEVAAEKVGEFYAKVAELQGLLGRAEEGLNAQGVVGTEVETIKQQLHEFKAVEREQVDSIQPKLQRVNAVGQGLIQSAAKHTDTQALEHDLEATNLRWNSLNKRVAERIAQLQEALLHCGKFQDALEPLLSWLSDTEELVANQKPPSVEYRVVKAQIQEQKLLQRLLDDRRATFQMIQGEGERIAATAETQDRDKIQKQLESLGERWGELLEKARARQCQLEELQTLALQFHEAVEPLGEWLSATERRLSTAEPMGTQTSKITQQITKHKSLNEEIVSRKKQVDQAIKNGQALLKQTTGEEVLLIQEKLDGIKSRYAEMTAGSSKALRTLEQALQLSTRFASAHDDLNQWLDKVEAELNVMEPDATPAYQDRQKELKCVSAEKRLVLDTVNEVGNALLDLVPWRAREGLDRLVADANQRYRTADETITQRVKLVQAAIQRSQQYEEAVDAELTWAGETERKLSSLGPLSLEPDVTVAQLQVQRAFNIDIIRHKDTVDQLLNTRDDILETCSDQQRDSLLEKTESLSARYEAVSQQHQERFSALEQAQVLVARFWETQEDLEPWLGETETLIAQLPPPAIDTEALRLQQEQMRLLRESIAEHKPHIDKLLKIGPQLAALSHQEGATVRQRYSDAEKRYVAIKEVIKGRATTLDEAVSQSAQFHDKMDPLLETLEGAVQRLRSPPPVAAEADKIREQLADHKATGLDLDKLLPSFSALCARGEELINRAAHDDPAAQGGCLKRTKRETLHRAEEREGKLTDVLDLAGKFWADMAALLSTLRDSQDIVKELEDPGVDPSLIKQQIEAAEAIKAETDGLREELEFVRTLGADLIFACGETEKPEVKKTIDEMNAAWEGLNRTWRERMERLEEAMTASVQYQDALQSMFDYLDNAVIKLCDMSTVGTDLGTVKQQIDELKQYKVEVYQQQIDMEKLCHQGELLLKKVSDQTDRDMIQEPLTELRHLWDNLGDKITHRQHKLEGALLALGQFQHALSELQSWLSHTHATLDTQRPINSDPKAIEIELAKHHVLRNDVLSHRSTVETVNAAGAELLESSPGDEANHLRDQLDHLNRGWENLLLKTQDRQKLLEAALHQAEGFHGELEEFLQWLRRTESQLSAAKPTGGLPETAREQLQQHLELQTQLAQRAEQYNRLLDAGESMLLSRGGEEGGPGAGTTQTQQNLALLQNKWASLNTKMDDRRAKLDEAVSLATGFQSSLQDTINWLTQAEQTLNMAQPPSLILDTVLFQIDEHKVFVNEVNTHREQVLALEKAGSQLRFASIKQDVVLIKNLLLSVQARWDKLVQRSLDRGRHLDEARKRAKQFHEAWRKLSDWLEEAESRLDSELEISNEPDKIKVQLTKHKEFQKALGSKQPVYDTTVRSGKAMRDKATLPEDTQKLDHLLGEVRDKWDTVCGKSVERQHKLEEALLFSGQFAEALQALVDWLYRVEPQLAEDLPVHGDLDLVSNLMDSHKAFQKELGKRTTSVHALKRSARELMETGRDDTAWVKVQLQELSNRWDTVCALSVTKQTRLQQAFKQAEEFRTAVHLLLEWLSEAEQTLRFRGVLPEEAETLQTLLHTHRNFMATVEEKRTDVNRAAGQGEAILTACQADCITTIKHWITIIRARFEEVLTWAKQHEQRLETALTELLNNATLLEELLSWLQWAETTLVQRDGETLPQDIPQLKTLITEHQVFMEEMTRKQPDVDKVTKTYKRKPAEAPSSLHQQAAMQVAGGNPRLTQLCSRWQQVWLLALDRQRKLNDALDRLEEVPLKEFASFDFDVWRKRYMRWMNHKKSRVMDFFRRIDKDQDGKITRQEFIDGILASKFPTSRLEMTAVADIFDQDGDGYIDYYEFVAALHPNKDAYRPTTDADKIEDEVTRQVAQCKCAKRFQVEQIGENKYRVSPPQPFGDSQQLRLVRILRSTVMVRVGGGWMALDEFLVKNDPCRARGRTNLELREKFILPEGASQGLAAFRSRGRRSKPGSRTASPTRSSSSASHSAHSCASLPSTPATPTTSSRVISGSKLKRPTFHSSRGSLTGENGGATPTSTKPGRTGKNKVRTPSGASGAASRAGSRAGSRASSRRGSDASDASELLETHSACSDTSDTPRRPGAAKPSKIPTISKKAPSPKTPTSGKK